MLTRVQGPTAAAGRKPARSEKGPVRQPASRPTFPATASAATASTAAAATRKRLPVRRASGRISRPALHSTFPAHGGGKQKYRHATEATDHHAKDDTSITGQFHQTAHFPAGDDGKNGNQPRPARRRQQENCRKKTGQQAQRGDDPRLKHLDRSASRQPCNWRIRADVGRRQAVRWCGRSGARAAETRRSPCPMPHR